MKARRLFTIAGALSLSIVVISFGALRPISFASPKDVSVSLLGYTNSLGTNMALLRVTNAATGRFVCFVGPRSSVASGNGRPLKYDVYPAADVPTVLSAPGAFTIAVVASTDTNLWHVSIRLQELNIRPKWKRRAAQAWGKIGVHVFEPRTYHVTSPAFGSGERSKDTQPDDGGQPSTDRAVLSDEP